MSKHRTQTNIPNESSQVVHVVPFIDQEVLSQFDDLHIEGEPDILIELIDSFLSSTPKRIEAMAQFVASADVESASKEAHALKSAAQSLGAKALGELCQQLEDFTKNKTQENIFELIEELKNSYQGSCSELKEIRTAHLRKP